MSLNVYKKKKTALSFFPSVLMPRMTYAASFLITPLSRTE